MSTWNGTKGMKRAALWAKQHGRCVYCGIICQYMAAQGSADAFTIDHIHPRSRGGSVRRATNHVGACSKCNQERGSNAIIVFVRCRRAKIGHPRRVIPACLALLDHCAGIGSDTIAARAGPAKWPSLGRLIADAKAAP